MVEAQIFQFADYAGTPHPNGALPKISTEPVLAPGSHGRGIEIEKLYPHAKEFNPILDTAQYLLKEAIRRADEALTALRAGDVLASDDCIQRLRVLLPDLFCCLSLGDGFASVILATYHSLTNLQGMPADEAQIEAIRLVMISISREPFLSFEAALSVHDQYEGVALAPDPRDLDEVGAALIGRSGEEAETEVGKGSVGGD